MGQPQNTISRELKKRYIANKVIIIILKLIFIKIVE